MKHQKRLERLEAAIHGNSKILLWWRDDAGRIFDDDRELTLEEQQRKRATGKVIVIVDWDDKQL